MHLERLKAGALSNAANASTFDCFWLDRTITSADGTDRNSSLVVDPIPANQLNNPDALTLAVK